MVPNGFCLSDGANCYVLCTFQDYLQQMFNKCFDLDELQREVGEMISVITDIMCGFLQLNLTKEEYVCLQVILLLNHSKFAVL